MISTHALLERFAIFLSTKIPNKYPKKEDQIEVFNFVLLGVWGRIIYCISINYTVAIFRHYYSCYIYFVYIRNI